MLLNVIPQMMKNKQFSVTVEGSPSQGFVMNLRDTRVPNMKAPAYHGDVVRSFKSNKVRDVLYAAAIVADSAFPISAYEGIDTNILN